MNELDFIESPQGMGMTPYPVQRVIIKAAFGIPMDYKEQMVPIWDPLHTELLYTFKETDYLKWKYDTGTGNVPDWRDIPEWGFNSICAFAGRRAGKSELVAAIEGAMLRNLLTIHDPQVHYRLRPGSFIDFTMMGTDELSSTRLYDKLRASIGNAAFFHPYLKANTDSEMTFVSEADRDRPDAVPSIRAAAYPCTSNSVRGPSSYCLALDEFAFFRSSKTANSEDLYKAATPSTTNFPNKEHPSRRDSRILLISSPADRLGKMYDLHRQAMDIGVGSNIFTINCYTAEMNPGLPASALADEYAQDPHSFAVEMGGKFRDGSGSYVPEIQVEHCVDRSDVNGGKRSLSLDRINITGFTPEAVGRRYFWGLDLGMKKDGTGLAIGHLQLTEGYGIELIIDYVDRMIVGEQFEGPGVPNARELGKYVDATELRIEDVVSWLVWMHQCLPCFQGLTDQGGGVQLKQLLQINGIVNMELVHITQEINSQAYYAMRGFIDNATMRFPVVPKFLREFKQLEAEYVSKHKLRVQAPNEKNAHDDMADAVSLVAYQATKWLDEEGNLANDPSGRILLSEHLLKPMTIGDPSALPVSYLRVLDRMQRHQSSALLPPGFTVTSDPFRRR